MMLMGVFLHIPTALQRTPLPWPEVGTDANCRSLVQRACLQRIHRDITTASHPRRCHPCNADAFAIPIGNLAEARAITLALGAVATVPASGMKALYGHPLGASGAIEATICEPAVRDGCPPASANLVDPIRRSTSLCRTCFTKGEPGSYRCVLATSFWFRRPLNAALVLRPVEG
jgi:3-oxoacyl-(acyl-carrier-protein) synthase